MRYGSLSDHFTGAAAKRLSAVETDRLTSNQHEYNGSVALQRLLGGVKLELPEAAFLWLGGEGETITDTAPVTWYDARERHPTRSEWRLYFRSNAVMDLAEAGDLLIVGRRPDGALLFIVTPRQSTLENQLAWLFGLDGALGEQFRFESFEGADDRGLDFVSRRVLEELGIEPEEPETDRLDRILAGTGMSFPPSRDFSELARQHAGAPDPRDDPDAALLAWIEFEELLFRRLERHIVAERLRLGFNDDASQDVDGFLSYALSIHNRRKARMGLSLENQVEAVLSALGIRHVRGGRTEGASKPDFLFPSAAAYHDPGFPSDLLSMLGVKSTLKDRWRQVLAEAARIGRKHLLTLEPAISRAQTEEMQRNSLTLVIPEAIHSTYRPEQAADLMSFRDFSALVLVRQRQAGLS